MKLYEEFKLFENMWDGDSAADSIDEKELDACFTRVTRAAQSSVDDDGKLKWIPVKLSKEDLKKALRLGSRGTYTNQSRGVTVPAQLVDGVVLCAAGGDGEASYIDLHLQGENPTTGENVVDYCDDIAVAASKTEHDKIFNSVSEFTNYCNRTIIPNADKIAHEIIEQAWSESGLKDYVGITDYTSSYADVTGYKVFYKDNMDNAVYTGTKPECDNFVTMIANMPYAKAHGGLVVLSESKAPTAPSLHEWKSAANNPQQNLTWEELLEKADKLLTELISVSGNEDYDDGDGYWSGEEGYEWCNRYLYYSDTLNNSNKLDELCDIYSNKLPNVVFYYVEDDDICEIGYTATNED
jgi:hypothetical protein